MLRAETASAWSHGQQDYGAFKFSGCYFPRVSDFAYLDVGAEVKP